MFTKYLLLGTNRKLPRYAILRYQNRAKWFPRTLREALQSRLSGIANFTPDALIRTTLWLEIIIDKIECLGRFQSMVCLCPALSHIRSRHLSRDAAKDAAISSHLSLCSRARPPRRGGASGGGGGLAEGGCYCGGGGALSQRILEASYCSTNLRSRRGGNDLRTFLRKRNTGEIAGMFLRWIRYHRCPFLSQKWAFFNLFGATREMALAFRGKSAAFLKFWIEFCLKNMVHVRACVELMPLCL